MNLPLLADVRDQYVSLRHCFVCEEMVAPKPTGCDPSCIEVVQ